MIRRVVKLVRRGFDPVSTYLPILMMGALALATYLLASNAPLPILSEVVKTPGHDPDYFMKGFAVRTFGDDGRLKSEVFGTEARHFPDTDTLEIDKVRMRSINQDGRATTATADRALSNADGSEVQFFGHAIVVREETTDPTGKILPRMEFRGEFLHAFVNTERIKSHLPVTLTRGSDQFSALSMDYDNLDRIMNLNGRVRGLLVPKPK